MVCFFDFNLIDITASDCKMKGFKKNPKVVAREAEGEYFLIPVGENPKDIKKILRLNQLGWFIWKRIDETKELDQLVSLICKAFDVGSETAHRDAQQFLRRLMKSGALISVKESQ
jgi:hypothetical protein